MHNNPTQLLLVDDHPIDPEQIARMQRQIHAQQDELERLRAALQASEAALAAQRAGADKPGGIARPQLAASRARLRATDDLLPIGIAVIDRDRRVVDCNQAATQLLDIHPGVLLRPGADGPDWRILRPDGSPMPIAEYASTRAIAQGGTVRDAELCVERKTGLTWLSVNATPIDDPRGGALIAFVDITARKLAEDQQRQTAERLGLATEAGGIGVWEWFPESNRLLWDRRMYELYRLRSEDFGDAYDAWIRALHPDDLTRTRADLGDALASHKPFNQEFRIRWPDGSLRWIKMLGKTFRNARGAPARMVGVNWDITASKRMEQDLEARMRELRAILDNSSVGISFIKDRRQVWANQRMSELFGYSLDTLVGMHTKKFYASEADYDRVGRDGYPRLLRGEPYQVECIMRRQDGGEFWARLRGKAIDPADPAAGSIWILADINQEKAHQAELIAAKEAAEEGARAKMRFLAHMSHEIRTPMNGIIGLSELALQRSLDATSRDYLEKIRQSGSNLLGILNDILDQSKIESGQLTLEETVFNPAELAEQERLLFAPLAQAKGLTLMMETDPDLPDAISGDALRIRQVLSNLLNNAIKFTEPAANAGPDASPDAGPDTGSDAGSDAYSDTGQVRLSIQCRERTASAARLQWTVADTGIGMDEAMRKRLFQPFAQGDDSIARRFGGTGLGLSISHQLVAMMDGCLEVESNPGQGSRFSFELRLPLATAAAPTPSIRASTQRIDLHGAPVLVVEDQPINQRVIGDMLALLGAAVTLADNGQQALDQLAATSFELVLMDIQMPGMDGLTATQRVRANPDWQDLPVIALTAGVTAEERRAIRAAGMNDLIPKPVTFDTLCATLAHWLPHATPVSDSPAISADPASDPASEPASNLSPITAALQSIGMDLGTLSALFEDPNEIADVLRQFAESVRDDANLIAAAAASQDIADLRSRAHRLCGTAGNLGAIALSDAARALEEAADTQPDRIAALLDPLRHIHAELLDRIAALPARTKMEGNEPADTNLKQLFATLHDILTEQRFVSQELLQTLEGALPDRAEVDFASLKTHLDALDYAAAKAVLTALESAALGGWTLATHHPKNGD